MRGPRAGWEWVQELGCNQCETHIFILGCSSQTHTMEQAPDIVVFLHGLLSWRLLCPSWQLSNVFLSWTDL